MPRPILIVEDDVALRSTLAEQIALEGDFEADEAGSLSKAEAKLSNNSISYDAFLLDVGLPDGDGCDFCARLRRDGLAVPILMLTGRDGEDEVVRGLDAGANDYLTKPFRLQELLARLRAQLRVFDKSESATWAIGRFLFRPGAKQLLDQSRDQTVSLSEKEVAILKFLYRAGGEPVPRERLLSEVWGYSSAATTHTLETHVYRLRQKIAETPATARLLITTPAGYRLGITAA